MQKFLRTLTLMALMLVPWVTQAQQTLTVADGTGTNSYVPVYGCWADADQHNQMIYPASMLEDMLNGTITALSFYPANNGDDIDITVTISLAEVEATTLSGVITTSLTQVWTGSITNISDFTSFTLSSGFVYNGGNLLVDVQTVTSGSYDCSGSFYGLSQSGSTSIGYGNTQSFLPKLTFTYTPGAAPTCAKPGAIAFGTVTGTTADISWTAGGSETSWNVYLNGVLTSDSPVSTPSYSFTGLSGLTTYSVAVEAICGSEVSTQRTASFTTSLYCANGGCQLHFACTDSYGDGWNGGMINVDRNGNPYTTVTANNYGSGGPYTDDFYVDVCKGDLITLSYTSGSYDSEVSFVVYDGAGDNVYSASTPSAGQFLTLSTPCPSCYKVSNLQASNMTTDGATLTWEADTRNDASATYTIYNVTSNAVYQTGVTGTTITLTGLNENTDYEFTVTTDCGGGDLATAVSVEFTTLANCQAPVLAANGITNVTAHTADVAWTGFASNNSYTVSYRTAAYFDGEVEEFGTSLPSGWENKSGLLSNIMSGSSFSTSTQWVFGSNNGVFDNHARINIYGTTRYGWLITPSVEVGTGYGLNFDLALTAYSGTGAASGTCDDDRFVVLISTDNEATWSILREWNNSGSAYVYNNIALAGENVTIDLSAYAGQTVKVAFYGESTVSGNGDNNMHIDNVGIGQMVPAGAWQTANVTTTSTTLTGLAGETIYDVNVTGVCGGSESDASATQQFTTAIACPATTDLIAGTPTPNSVELSWTENGTATAWQLCINDDETNLRAVNTNPFTLEGLTASTAYTVKVRANCGGIDGQSAWSNTVNFTTQANCPTPVFEATGITNVTAHTADVEWTGFTQNDSYKVYYRTAEYVDGISADFENGSMPAGWTTEGNGTWSVGTGDYSTSTGAHGGTKNALIKHGTTGNTTYLVTSAMDLSGRSGMTLNMWYINRSWSGDIDEFGVYYRIDGGAWNEIFATTSAHASWTELNVNLPSGAYAANCQIGFKMTDSYGYGVAIDDILMGETIPAGAWQTVPTNTTSTTLTGLASETSYEVKIEGICGGSPADEMSDLQAFTTLPSCMAITGLTVSDVTTNSVTLTWTDNANTGATYTIYNVTDNNSIVASGVNATTYTVTNLTENTAYTFGVLPICQEGETTPVTVSTRTACAAKSLPWTCGFEAEEIQSTTQATALPWCSYRYVTPGATSGTTYPYSYSSSTYAHNSTRSLYFYGTTSTSYPAQMAFILPEVDVTNFPMNGNRVTFYAKSSSTSYNKVVHVGTMTDPTDWSTYTEVGTVTVTGTTHTLYKSSLSTATSTDAYVVLMVERGSGSLYIDDVTLEELPACVDVTNLAVDNATGTTVTLTWTDADNEDVTYTIYNMDDNSTIATGVVATTYTVTGLTGNTPYTFGVQANCLTGDAPVATVAARTACVPYSLPLTWTFEADELMTTSNSATTPALPWCSYRYASGTTNLIYPYSYSSSTYAHNSTRSLYFYGTTSTSYPAQMAWIMPEVDVTNFPMNGNRITFYARSSSTSYNKVVHVGTMTDPTDISTFTELGSVIVSGTAHTKYTFLLDNAVATDAHVALMVERGSGNLYIDDVTLEEIPTMVSVEASNVTANSVDLNWEVFRSCNGVAYTVTYGTQSVEVSTTSTTISDLTPNTEYTFTVSSSCAAPGEPTVSVSVNTLQIPATLPYVTGFEASDDRDWTMINDANNGWYFGTAANNGGEQGLYISNDGGVSNAYTNNAIQWSYAYRMMNFSEAGWYKFNFDWMAYGEGNYDYLRAWLAPTVVSPEAGFNPEKSSVSVTNYRTVTPEGWIDLNPVSGKLNLQSSWQSIESINEVAAPGTYTLVLMWANDGSGGTNPPAAVDNVSVVRNAFEPTDLTATNITATGATLTWTRDTRNAGVETYTIKRGTEIVATDIDANSYDVTLTPNTDYTFTLFAVTDGDVSDAENVSLRVNEYPTEAGRMVNLAYSYDFTAVADEPSVSFYYGMGDTRAAEAAQTLTAETATEATFTNTTSANWAVDGPVTVVFLNHNANVLNFTPEVTYLCPTPVTNTDPVVETINTGSYTWTTPENHEYTYGPLEGTTLGEQVEALVGTYHDTVLNVGNCDSIYRHLNLTLYPTYEVTLTDEFCQGTTYTVGTGAEAHNYTASVQEDVHLTAAGGADSLVHVDLHMNAAPVALINNNVNNTINSYCEGFDLILTASAVEGASVVNDATYMWEDASTAATRTVNPLSTTTNVYTLSATDPVTGCVSLEPATLTVTTTPVPVLTVTADREAICVGQNSAVLTVTDANNIEGVNFRWYNANTTPATVAGTGATLTVNPTETTNYYVVAEGDCEVQSAPITITVNPLPVVEVAATPAVICQNDMINLTATTVAGYNYSWSTGAATAEATVAAAITGNYTVTVTDQNGCVSDFTTNNVTVNPVYELNDAQSVCYLSNPYTWKAGSQTAMSITEDGNYNYTFQTVNGCDSLVHLTFAFEQMSVNNTYREVCQNSDVIWGPTTYASVQESATLTYELGVGDIDPDNNVLDCPAQYNLILTVNPVKATTFDQVACDSYTWTLNNETYTADTTPSVTLATAKGCDSVVTMNLTVNYQNTGVDTQVACDRYEWPLNHNIYTESNTTAQYTLTGANAFGCDSVVTLNLTVNYKQDSTVFHRECGDTVFVWSEGNGLTYKRNVNPEDNITWNLTTADPTMTTADGCDSILRLHLVMNYVTDTLNWATVEECDSWYIDTVACDGKIVRAYYDESNDSIIVRTRNAATGRDQISRIHLVINRSEHQTVPMTACVPYTWDAGQGFSHEIVKDTVLSQELLTTSGCKLIKVLRFTAKYPTEKVTPVTLCQNDSWTDGKNVEYLAANYELGENDPVQWNQTVNAAGCDSIDYVVFTVNPVYNVEATLTYCENEFTNNAITYANPNKANETIELTIPGALNQTVYSNTVVADWTTQNGCDSIVTITYTVNPIRVEDIQAQNCYTYTWMNGADTINTYTASGDYTFNTQTVDGCDSTANLHLTIADTVIGVVNINACGEYTYQGVTYRESKTFYEESGYAIGGCDSITRINYILTPRVMKDVYVVANAPYTWDNNVEYTASVEGIYYDATEPGGCDSILVLHLTMEQPIVICENELPYTTTFGVTLTADTTNYTETINGVLYDIDYTVNHNTVETVTVDNACDSYTWSTGNGETYTVSGNYTFETVNAKGCDSTVTLALTVNNHQDNEVSATVCDTYTWADNNNAVYTESGNYTRDITDANGCAATETLVLTINQHQDNEVEATACDTYTWADNNNTEYTTSGSYTRDITDANGCAATETLVLTVNQHQDAEVTDAACESYTWVANNNTVYNTSGSYTRDITDANGCAATETLALTINHATEYDLTVVRNEASTYYNGNYYADINEANAGLPYTFDVLYEGANAKGCDSTDHVTLYVTRGTVTDENYNICGNFTWNRNNHTYTWIPAEERTANGNALYKDITDANAPVYIHTGENPTAMELDANGVATHTYVLWLNMVEANYYTIDLGTIMLSDVTSMDVNPGDSLNTRTIDFSEYFTNKQSEPNFSDTIHHTSTYYCENVVTYTANLVYNYDTVDPVTVCDATTWTDPVNDDHTVTTGINEFDYLTADNWHHHIVVTNKARTTSDPQVVTVCDTYTWTAGDNETYTTSGSYNWNNNDTAICSLETLNLTVNSSNTGIDTKVACDTYTWVNGTTYTASNTTDTVMRTNVAGCDSTVTLNLTINYSNTGVDNQVACDSYTWINGTTYTASNNTDTAMRTNFAGCDSVITLNLTINTNAGSEATVAQCLTYTWNVPTYVYDDVTMAYVAGTDISNTYNGSAANGDKTVNFTDANGCEGTATLHLTIYDTVNTSSERFEYGNGYTFHGSFYTPKLDGTDSVYTIVYDTVDANNCAIKDTLTLHVSQYVYTYINKVECGTYTWTAAENGNGHTYRVLTAEEAAANPTAAFFDVDSNTAVANMQQNVNNGNIYVLNLTLNTPVVKIVNDSVPMSQLVNGIYTTVDGDIDCSEAVAAGATTLVTASFSMAEAGMGPFTACDSIVRYNVNVIYNYVTDDNVGPLCAATTYEVVAGDVRTINLGENTLVYTLNAGLVTEEVHTVVVTNNDYAPATPQVVEVCDTYTWTDGNGQTYTSSTTVNWNNDATCTAETLQLTINTNAGSTESVTECDTYTWNAPDGEDYTYTEGGVKTVQFTDANGCEGTATLNLTINTNAGTTETETACDSYTWQYMAEPLTESNVYNVNYTDANGCEGVHTLNLTINAHQDAEFSDAACVTYTWTDNNDAVYTTSGDYTRAIVDANNCPATETLHLTINQPESADEEYWFGDGSYRYTGIHTTATGHMYMPGDYTGITETVAGATANGCDSIYNITLHVGNNYTHTDAVRSCATYTWNRNNVTYARLTDAQSAQYPTALYFDQTNDEPVYYNPVVVEPRVNDYADEYMLDLTLDAITERDTTINFPVSLGILTYAGETYDYTVSNDEGREISDTTYEYEIHLSAVQACDSIINLTVNVVKNYVFDSVVDLCYSVASYTWEGQTLTLDANPDVANTYYMYSANDADTTVHWIKVNQHPIQYTTERRTNCESYTWNGMVFTESTSNATFDTVDMWGCDSTVTLVLYINHATSQTLGTENAPVEACDGYTWILGDGTELPDKIEQSGTYTWDYNTAEGCESHDTLYLTVNTSTHTEEELTACDSYTWNAPDGQTYVMDASEEKLVNYTNDAGCASTAKLTLTVNQSSSNAVAESACDSYTWTVGNGETYTESGVYPYTTTNAAGCDSIVTLTLTIDKSNGRTEVTACDSYTWTLNGETYTESGAYKHISNVANACGSLTDSLFLTINKNSGHSEEVAICNSNLPATGYEWNGSYYSTTDEYYYNYTDGNNCPSQDTLKLTIGNVRSYGRVYVENCGPYTWDLTGETFTESTEVSTIMDGGNAVGCDSVIMLYLTIYEQPVINETVTICDNELVDYSWRGIAIAAAGEYTDFGGAYSEHCDSVYNLTLTVNERTYSSVDVTYCDSYEWNGETYTESGVYTYTTTNAAGCDNIDTLHLTINVNNGVEETELACDSYEWNGTNYTESGDYTVTYQDANGCSADSVLHLTIANSENNSVSETACDSYTWTAGNGETYTESGTYTYNYNTPDGCIGVKTLELTVNSSSSAEVSDMACDSYEWNGETYTASGVYTYTTTNAAGCDSVVTLNLTINYNSNAAFTETACDSYEWNGTEYITSGDYTYSYTNAAGCATTDTLHLTINYSSDVVTINETACDSYEWTAGNGETYTESGVYTYTTTGAAGCDSTVTLTLTINTSNTGAEEQTACDSYTWNGETYTESGVYTFNTTNAAGCDSTATLTLTVNTSNTGVDVQTACDTYTWIDNNVYTASNNTATYTVTNVAGCDSVVTLNLTINNSVATSFADVACNAYVWEGSYYTESGDYTKTFEAVNGCDSVVTLTLTINQPVAETITETACGSYTWNGITYNASGSYTQTGVAANGCDSVTTLTLTINQPVASAVSAEACDSYTWNGDTYTTSGNYTYTTTAANGCDSVVTLTLTINTPANTTEDATACESYTWHGQVYTTNGAYTYNFTDANGCAAVATLNLTINTPANTTESVTACNSYSWNNQTYTNSGVYTNTFVDANGCNATATLNLTINNPVNAYVSATACESYTWNGQTYTTSGNYTFTATAANGCDSVTTLTLTVNQPTTATVYAEACGSYTWNGQTYTQPGAYTYTTTGSNGCDSITTLLLNLVQPVQTIINQTACDSYTWNGTTYTTSGSYTYTATAANGCDSVVTLNLTINNSVSSNFAETACNSYTWNGQAYTTSGTYTQVFTAHNGCDSTVTLNLTINTPTTATVTETACSSFDWNGETYTQSGSYTYTTTGANGCDSVTTLLLTINLPVYTNLDVNAEGSYNWNGETYTESGVYTYTTTAANGCDSVVTLTLTITPVYTVTLVSSNEAWGSVSESGTVAEYGYFTAEATANEGYEFVAWMNGTDTVSTSSTYIFQVTEDITLTAVFAEVQGISVVDMSNVVIYSNDTRIFVNGAEGYDVYVYDVNGRVISRQLKAADAIEFRMSTTGVYLVKVGNAPAKRVIVVR